MTLLLLALMGCSKPQTTAVDLPDTTPVEEPTRIVAFGDVHGDATAARAALQLAGVLNDADAWIGGTTQVVQIGDQLDRGDNEQEILDLFDTLRTEANAAGGAFYPLLGNHEIMNIELDFRYVTEGGFADFADTPYDETDPLIQQYPDAEKGRAAAFRPGGPYATLLSAHHVTLQLEDSLFVHGGILPAHVEYGLDAINEETREWMRAGGTIPDIMNDSDAPTWSRHYSDDTDEDDCALLDTVLSATGASRIVVAHTVQDGINSACGDRIWRVDVGMAAYYGGSTQVLEIVGGGVQVLAR